VLIAVSIVLVVVALYSFPPQRIVTTTQIVTATATIVVTKENVTSIINQPTSIEKVTSTVKVGNQTITVYGGGIVGVGNCTATSYFEADTVALTSETLTSTSGSVTSTYVTTTAVYPTPHAENSSTFSTTTLGQFTVGEAVTSTSDEGDRCAPSGCWIVTVCDLSVETGY